MEDAGPLGRPCLNEGARRSSVGSKLSPNVDWSMEQLAASSTGAIIGFGVQQNPEAAVLNCHYFL